ncbi:MAG: DUF1573 domain-containing protein [Verrucomicrobia bacterium]|nr:DUF1573 domain-containing protein [Verrucomicrobiota bacterium]
MLHAGLVIDQEPLELFPKPEDEVVEGDFTFTNKSDKPIRITGLESSCSCLEATLDKPVYEPGEKGKGHAKFKVSSFTGKHEKVLHIYTDDPASPDTILTAVIDIPVIVSVEPKLVQWIIGDQPEPKEFTVLMTGKDPIHLTQVESTRQTVTATFKEITPGREYRIIVTPSATTDVIIGAVTLRTDSVIPKYQRQLAFYNIVRPEQAEKQKKSEAK